MQNTLVKIPVVGYLNLTKKAQIAWIFGLSTQENTW